MILFPQKILSLEQQMILLQSFRGTVYSYVYIVKEQTKKADYHCEG